ncbi:XRE family transcriptional regulator [Peterkaempfera sp. SMS 1(5)a]
MPDTDQVTQALARNLKRLRTERGHTLDSLAARSGVSRGMVVQIEQARTNPSVGTVVRLADALGVSIARLLDYAEGPSVRLVPGDRAVPLWTTPAGSSGTLLAGVEAPGPLELWSWRIEPGEGHGSESHPAGTVELVRVDEGELTLTVDGRDHIVPAGTTATFDAAVAHRYGNAADRPLLLTMVVSVPPLTR